MGNWVARPDQLLSLDSLRLFSDFSLPWLVGCSLLARGFLVLGAEKKDKSVGQSVSPLFLCEWRVK